MHWLIWQQHKKQYLILGVLLAIYAILILPIGLSWWHTYQHALETCGSTNGCNNLSSDLLTSSLDNSLNPSTANGTFTPIQLAIMLMPVLLGIFVGVPLIANEYADGTDKLVWMQGISRRRWVTVTLLWTFIATVIFAGIFAALTTWWSQTGDMLYLNRFGLANFSIQGIVPIAYTFFAVAAGIAIGTWLKRLMPAIALTLGLLVIVQLIVVPNMIRPHYETPVTEKVPLSQSSFSQSNPSNLGPAWILTSGTVNAKGQTIHLLNPPQPCAGDNQSPITTDGAHIAGVQGTLNCLIAQGGYYSSTQYQPAYRYWDFQLIESVLYLGLSIIPIVATYWLVMKRDA